MIVVSECATCGYLTALFGQRKGSSLLLSGGLVFYRFTEKCKYLNVPYYIKGNDEQIVEYMATNVVKMFNNSRYGIATCGFADGRFPHIWYCFFDSHKNVKRVGIVQLKSIWKNFSRKKIQKVLANKVYNKFLDFACSVY